MRSAAQPLFVLNALSTACLWLAAGAGPAWAQSPPPASIPVLDEAEKITITGSRIRRIDAEAPLPVQVISAEQLRQSGKTSVTEVLQALAVNGANGLTDSQSFSNFAYGASGVSLRGLGPTATLVLINGRRVAPYSVPDINRGLTNFVNVDAIPRGAIQRIEILKDGASAIYGSDAMAGVVNIILRNDYQGGELEVNAQSDGHGDFGSRWAGLTLGRGDADKNGWQWMLTLDAYHRNEVMLRDVADRVIDDRHRNSSFYYTGRPYNNRFTPTPNYYSQVFYDSASGAAFSPTNSGQASANCPAANRWAFNGNFNPALSLCGYSYWDEAAQYVSPLDRQTAFGRGEVAMSGGVRLFGELSLTRLENKQRDWAVPFGSGLGATPNGRDGGVASVPQFLPAGHPNNPFANQDAGITYLFEDVGKQGIDVRNTTTRALVGARGTWQHWDWEAGLLHGRDQARVTYLNRVSLPVLRQAVLDGSYNFEAPASGTTTADDLRITPVDRGQSQFTTLDFKWAGDLVRLPAGPLGLAAGVELRRESRYYRPDDRIFAGEVYLQVAGRTEGSRHVATAYTELSLPITKDLVSQLALRSDRYSDYGTSTTPKLALAWKAHPMLKLRASHSGGFRAPSLNEVGSSDTPLFAYADFDARRCGDYNVDCDGYNISGVVRANKALQAETSSAYSAGLVFEPRRGLSLSLDYWQFDRRNEIVALTQQEVMDNEGSSNPLFAGRVRRLPDDTFSVPGQTIPGRITSVETQYVNRGRTQVRGVDLDARVGFDPVGWGRVDLSANLTYLDRDRVQVSDGEDWVVRTGHLNSPRLRGSLGLQWRLADWSAGATLNYLSGFRANLANQACVGTRFLGVCEVDHDLTLDLHARLVLSRAVTLNATVRNVGDSRMPFTPTATLGNRYWYSAAGRVFSLAAAYTF